MTNSRTNQKKAPGLHQALSGFGRDHIRTFHIHPLSHSALYYSPSG
jgi:hypothetical protein